MPIKLSPPVTEEFRLEKSDKILNPDGEPTLITIKQATEGDNVSRTQLWSLIERKFSTDEGMLVRQDVSPAIVKRREIYLTLVACNLADENGELLFPLPMSEDRFNLAYAKLPPIVANEIHEKVLEVNLTWAMEGESS